MSSAIAFESIFNALVQNQHIVRATTWKQRVSKLRKLHEAVLRYQPDIRQALWDDFRKPAAEVDFSEIYPVTSDIKFTAARLKRWMKPSFVWPTPAMALTVARIQYEPKGVVLIISPWNFPFQLAISPLISAIAAGNAVVLKPSELTPNVSAVIKKLLLEVFPENEVAVVEGGADVAQSLLSLPFNHVFFTGSPRVGKLVMEAASKHLAEVTLELGGKSPVIAAPDADLDDLADKLVFGKCMNAGQTCVAPDYLLVHESLKNSLITRIKARLEQRYGSSDQIKRTPDFARIVNDGHFSRISKLVDEAVASGATLLWGNERIPEQRLITPTVLELANDDAAIMEEEIFGPVLPLLTYNDLSEAIHLVNKRPKPLALYIFSKDKNTIQRVLSETSAGGTCVNDLIIQFMHHNLPFGGVNNSGIGQSHGRHGFLTFSHKRSILINPIGWNPAKWMYPPYTPRVRRFIDLVIRWF